MILAAKWLSTSFIVALVGLSANCHAQDSSSLRFAQEFVGVCAQDFPAVDKIKAAAKVFNWKEITDPNMRAMMGPASPDASWQGWLVIEKEDKYFVGISEGDINGKKTSSCSLVQDRVDVDSIISELAKILNAKKVEESTEAGQRQTLWEYQRGDERFLLTTVDGTPMKMMLLTATVITDFRGTN
jgi:hypothetical protein